LRTPIMVWRPSALHLLRVPRPRQKFFPSNTSKQERIGSTTSQGFTYHISTESKHNNPHCSFSQRKCCSSNITPTTTTVTITITIDLGSSLYPPGERQYDMLLGLSETVSGCYNCQYVRRVQLSRYYRSWH
jgi:hypothetical protein